MNKEAEEKLKEDITFELSRMRRERKQLKREEILMPLSEKQAKRVQKALKEIGRVTNWDICRKICVWKNKFFSLSTGNGYFLSELNAREFTRYLIDPTFQLTYYPDKVCFPKLDGGLLDNVLTKKNS